MKSFLKNDQDFLMVKEARESGKGHNIWIEILIFILIFLIANIIQGIVILPVGLSYMFKSGALENLFDSGNLSSISGIMDNLPESYIMVMLFSTVVIILTALIYCRCIEKRSFKSMGLVKQKALKEYGIGMLIGVIMFAVVVLLCVITGSVSIKAASAGFAFGTILLFFIGFIIQGMSEELLCRGYFMISMARKSSLLIAIFINSITFAVLHLLNDGITVLAFLNLVLYGLFSSVYMVKRGSIWGAAAIHTAWNFMQGNFFGFKVSGIHIKSTVFTADISDSLSVINGGTFGPEGGLAVTVVLLVGIFMLLRFRGTVSSETK